MNEFTPPSPTFCVLPWIHLSTKTNGEIRLCCTTSASSAGKFNDKDHGGKLGVARDARGAPANLSRTSLSEAWNSEYMRSVRQQMLRGERPLPCSKCHKEEAAGVRSKRQWETEYWSQRLDIPKIIEATEADGRVPEKIRYLDLRFGHLCNLRCTMCSPHDSSSWISDWRKLHPKITNPNLRGIMSWEDDGRADGASYSWHENKKFWPELYAQIPYLQQLYFAGGEPLLLDEHYRLLEECVRQGQAKKITLRYNSNGTHLPDRALELWKEFRQVRFGFSLDSFGEMNHYIRHPAKWSTIEQNLRRLDATGDSIEVTLACAVQSLNIFYIPEFIQWKLSQGFRKINPWPLGAGMINFHFVYHPANLNVKSLPLHAKIAVAEKFERFYPWLLENYRADDAFLANAYGIRRLKAMIKFMFSEDWSNRHKEFVEYITLLDSIRGTSFSRTFPEFASVLDSNLAREAEDRQPIAHL